MRKSEFILLALAILLIAVGFLAVLPPFEGFDETAHYSSIQQIADTGTIPRYGQSFLSLTVIDYSLHGPLPYSSLNPPFDRNGGMTYAVFFASPDHVAAYKNLYRNPFVPRFFQPSKKANWQSQHPPLYYLLMASLMNATASWSFVTQLFALRLVSFLFAFAGLMIGLYASVIHSPPTLRRSMLLGFLLYPLIVPMFFAEFARLGNDSLCLLLFGMIWAVLLRWLEDEYDSKRSLLLGILLGLGLLTKAFFLPITFGIGLFVLFRIWCERSDQKMVASRLKQFLLMFAPPLMLGGSWYVYNLLLYGSFIGGSDFITLTRRGGLLANLKGELTSFAFVRGIVATLVTWSWGGTWSLTRINEMFRIPLLVLTGWLFINYVRQARYHILTNIVWLPVWLFAPFFIGLVYHVFVGIALTGSGNTPGWYLHILAPIFAFVFAFGIAEIKRDRIWQRILFKGLLAYTVFFLIIVNWMQMVMFAGLAIKGDNKYYQFPDHFACLTRANDVLNNLSVLGWPFLAVVCFCGGLLCLIISLVGIFRVETRQRVSD
ncbi:hypothetical protein ASZ90_006914 [hydrocarbon metagenome]|uniref:Glycosyltransferase RgtA/B/C/D-like domain-containing protein n=1 Tax=hydrocarbon metagenome TaxID=938273 RepID=A0A0W8FQP5_9ZZZZ